MQKILLLFVLAVCCLCQAPSLKSYNITPTDVAVSGVSAGGYMAVQLHIAYSSMFKSAGIIAAGPFWCANDNIEIALTSCMKYPVLISNTELWAITAETAATGYIDPLSNLQNDRVWIMSGKLDTVVNPGVVKKLEEYYGKYVNTSNIKTNYNLNAEHAWITNSYGSACATLGSPFINNCQFDAAEDMMQQLYWDRTNWKPRVAMNMSNLLTFDQSEFIGGTPELYSLDRTGFIYVPSACQQGAECALMVSLHGCEQSFGNIGQTFVSNAGFNEWAESNKIIVVYPQVKSSFENPKACWDWWGYTGPAYASNQGLQMVVMKNIMHRIMSK